jgi:hypothetical protein
MRGWLKGALEFFWLALFMAALYPVLKSGGLLDQWLGPYWFFIALFVVSGLMFEGLDDLERLPLRARGAIGAGGALRDVLDHRHGDRNLQNDPAA